MSIVKLLWVLCLATASHALFAHQDAIIYLKAGKLEGLPEKYQTASFSLTDRTIGAGWLSAKIPPCIWKYFANAKAADLQFTASWYHDLKMLPPYISISVPEAGTMNRVQLLLNLDTLAPISFEKVIFEGAYMTQQDIPLEKTCLAAWSVVEKK